MHVKLKRILALLWRLLNCPMRVETWLFSKLSWHGRAGLFGPLTSLLHFLAFILYGHTNTWIFTRFVPLWRSFGACVTLDFPCNSLAGNPISRFYLLCPSLPLPYSLGLPKSVVVCFLLGPVATRLRAHAPIILSFGSCWVKRKGLCVVWRFFVFVLTSSLRRYLANWTQTWLHPIPSRSTFTHALLEV